MYVCVPRLVEKVNDYFTFLKEVKKAAKLQIAHELPYFSKNQQVNCPIEK